MPGGNRTAKRRTAKEQERLTAFGLRVKVLRTQARLTQDELGVLAGLHRTFIGQIERGRNPPSTLALWPMAEALGVTIPDLFRDIHGTPIL